MSSRADELRVIQVDQDHVIGTWAEFLLCVWRLKTELGAVHRTKAIVGELIKAHPDGIGMLTVIEQDALPPEQHVRREIAALMAGAGTGVKASCLVHEGTGFKAATVRGIVTAIGMFKRLPYPHEVRATVGEGAEWLTKNMGKPLAIGSARALSQVVEDLRRELDRLTRPAAARATGSR